MPSKRATTFDAKSRFSTLALANFQAQFALLLTHVPTALAGTSPEGVHQMRVAIRRLRAGLRTFKIYSPVAELSVFRQDLKWLGQCLGPVRDLDVYLQNLPILLDRLSPESAQQLSTYQRHLRDEYDAARLALERTLRGDRFRILCQAFPEACQQIESRASHSGPKVAKIANKSIWKQHHRVLTYGHPVEAAAPDARYHELRIECKRLRYVLEFFRPVYGDQFAANLGDLKKLQDLLGEMQDASVAVNGLVGYSQTVPMQTSNRSLLLALGELMQCQRHAMKRARKQIPDAWDRFTRKNRYREIRLAIGPAR